MTDEPTIRWIAEADPFTLRHDIARASGALRTLLKDPPDDQALIDQVVKRIMRMCSDAGPGELTSGEVLQLVYPLFLYLERSDRFNLFREDIVALASARPELQTSSATAPLLAGLVTERTSSSRRSQSTVVPSVPDLDCSDASSVFTMLETLLANGEPIPIEIAEALFLDGQLWSTPAAAAFAETITQPLRPQDVGLAASVLLNSRLRLLRPRIFLRYPTVLVAEEIGTRTNWDDIRRETMDLISEPMLRTTGTIDSEINRPEGRRPRKTVFAELRSHLERVIELLGYEFEGIAGAETRYDPETQLGTEPLSSGTEVLIRRPGLRDVSNGQTIVKALVEPITNPEIPS